MSDLGAKSVNTFGYHVYRQATRSRLVNQKFMSSSVESYNSSNILLARSLRSERFRGVLEQRKTEERDFR